MDAPMTIEARMRADLPGAMKARDKVAVIALRTTLAAIANAEAPPVQSVISAPARGRLVDHPRMALTDSDVGAVIRREIATRQATVAELGLAAAAAVQAEITRLQAQAAVLETYLS